MTQVTDILLSDYKDWIAKMVCQKPTPDCYLDKCTKCPGTTEIIILLHKELEDSCISHVKCSIWTSTNKATLLTFLCSVILLIKWKNRNNKKL